MSVAVNNDSVAHQSPKCHDGNVQTSCITGNVEKPFLEITFGLDYVHKVLLINRKPKDDDSSKNVIIERINGAMVDLSNDGKYVKSCGTISTSGEKELFWVDCNAVGTTIEIHLDRTDNLNLAEVMIYTLGKLNIWIFHLQRKPPRRL